MDDHSQIPVIHSMQDTEEADNKLVCIDDESALASKTELQEPIEASKENCSLADECQAVSAVHILHSTANHVSESCIVNKSNLNCGVDAASEGLTTCLDIEDGADQISSESTESDALECNVSKEVLQLTSGLQDCETDNSVSSTNLTESMEVSECAKLRECNTELMKSAEKAWDNQAEAITKSTLEGGSTPTSKKRKSMDMVIDAFVYCSLSMNKQNQQCHYFLTC